MILAYHLIFTAYGFWLPNDPRGSWSNYVRQWELLRFGPATKVETHRSVAHVPHDRAARFAAKQALQHAPVRFTGTQAVLIANGFKEVIKAWNLSCFACAILPDHAHVVLGRTHRDIRHVMNQMKGRASQRLAAANLHPFQNVLDPKGVRLSPWARKGWHVFMSSSDHVMSAILYVENNPLKDGLRRQSWSFVSPYPVAIGGPEGRR